jgi:transposase
LASTTPELDDARWAQVAALVPPIRRSSDQSPLDQRMILAGILWVMRTGSSWRDLPACFGYWETIHDYYHRWKQKGSWQPILAALRAPLETVPP